MIFRLRALISGASDRNDDGLKDDDGPDRPPGRKCARRAENGADPAPTAPEPRDPLAEAKREAAEYKDKVLRTLAEMENLRKRTEREVADARLYGNASFARDVLAVADNMQRAFDAMGPELREQGDAKVQALVEGVELTERELLKMLEKHGVKKFSPMARSSIRMCSRRCWKWRAQTCPPVMSRR